MWLKSNQALQEKYLVSVQNKFEVLGGAEEVDQQWVKLKVWVTEAAVEHIPRVKRETKQKWMTEDILEFMEKRKHAKK